MHSGIYIHIPFCESKCGYCDFFSITEFSHISKFLSVLEKEIEIYSREIDKKEVFDTIYIGGGTPSVLSPKQINNILDLLNKKFRIIENSEITIEVNPGTVNKSTLTEFKKAGINRLSIGVQSFTDNELKFLERIHNAKQSIESLQFPQR